MTNRFDNPRLIMNAVRRFTEATEPEPERREQKAILLCQCLGYDEDLDEYEHHSMLRYQVSAIRAHLLLDGAQLIRECFAWFAANGELTHNPALNLPGLELPPRPLSQKQFEALEKAAKPNVRQLLALHLIARVGLTLEEAAQLRLEDVNEAHRITLVARPLRMSARSLRLFERLPRKRPRTATVLGADPSTIEAWFRTLGEQARLDGTVDAARLRYSLAHALCAQGVHYTEVRKRLGDVSLANEAERFRSAFEYMGPAMRFESDELR